MPQAVMDHDYIPSAIVGMVDPVSQAALLLRRFDDDREFPGQWCFPGGRAHPEESANETAAREALEETGLTVQSLEYVGRRESAGASGRTYLIDCFVTQSWTGSLRTFPSTEHAATAWVPLDRLADLGPTGSTTRWLAQKIRSRFEEPN